MFIATAVASMVSFNYRLIYDVKRPVTAHGWSRAIVRGVILYGEKKKIQYLTHLIRYFALVLYSSISSPSSILFATPVELSKKVGIAFMFATRNFSNDTP